MKKFFGSLFILVLAVLVFVVVAKDWIIKTSIEQGVTRVTGFNTHVGSVRFDFPSALQIKDLHIQNPAEFQEKTFVNIPEIYAAVSFGELIKGTRLHLPEVRLNIQEVNVEKNEKGVSNVELLSSVGGKPAEGSQAEQPAQPSSGKQPMPFLLDKLELTIGKVSFADRSGLMASAPLPKKLEMDLNVDHEVMTNISDAKSLVNLILAKVLSGATLGKLLNIDPKALLSNSVSGVMNTGQELVGSVTDQAQNLIEKSEVTKKAEALLGDSSTKAAEVLGSATGEAKEKVSALFGKLKSPLGGGEQASSTETQSSK